MHNLVTLPSKTLYEHRARTHNTVPLSPTGASSAVRESMEPSNSSGDQLPSKKRSSRATTTSIYALGHDILCTIFLSLDVFDLARCSTVCKYWNTVLYKSQIFQVLYYEQNKNGDGYNASTRMEKSLKKHLEGVAMERHRRSLQKGCIDIDQWKVHNVGITRCRMKMGLVVTGCGDKVVRLWSLERSKCLEEYTVPNMASLVDFDFDESKIVGLLGTRMCLWSRNGKRSIFPPAESAFSNGLCMRYIDPDAVVGCEDGTVRVFDMYSRTCSQIIRLNMGPVRCLSLTEDHLVLSGSPHGNITISSLSADRRVAMLRSTTYADVRTLCYNPSSHLLFAGSTAGYASCWDIRKMRALWEKKVSPNVIYSIQHLRNDTSRLVAGGIDGVLRVLDQDSGELLSSCVMESRTYTGGSREGGMIERKRGKRVLNETRIDSIPKSARPPITCLAVGMNKVITAHGDKYLRTWKFNIS